MILKLTLILWVCSYFVTYAEEALCSSDTFDDKCLCQRFTHQDTNLPASVADCNGMELVDFPDISKLPDDLTELYLSMNNLSVMKSSPSVESSTLKLLDLSDNLIIDISEEFFSGFPMLKVLILSHNNLNSLSENVFNKQTKLETLDLSYNSFINLPDGVFYPTQSLKTLDLSYNPLGLSLIHSKDILSRTLGISTNLTRLNLNNVGLRDMHPDYFTVFIKLENLELQDNEFNYLPTIPASVEHFDFSGNNLSDVSAKYLNYHFLRTLRLSRMPSLQKIEHYAFYNLQSLESLTITDCPNLKEFSELAFGLASKNIEIHPTTLNLERNGILSLNSTYVHMFRRMEHIDLRHNPWECNCDVLWLQEFSAELFKGRQLRCASPSNVRNRRLLELTHVDMQQCFPEIYGKTSHRVVIIILTGIILFLIGLIFYLLKYPHNWVSPKDLGLGPTSPYSLAPQEERNPAEVRENRF